MQTSPPTVFLTGASAGIGLATAQLLTQGNYQVWGTSRSLTKLPKLPNFHPLELDLGSTTSIRDAFTQAEKEAGHFDILINNAGEGVLGALEAFTPENFREQLEVLLLGPHELIRLALPAMRERNRGTIVNVSSLAARFPVPFLGPYSAAKAALANYTETLRLELTATQIRVVDLQPGDIATSFPQAIRRVTSPIDSLYSKLFQSAWKVMETEMPHGPQPETVAHAISKILASNSYASPVTVGTFYQAVLSPFLARILPKQLMEQGLRNYYKLR